jgi:hypothetical protein
MNIEYTLFKKLFKIRNDNITEGRKEESLNPGLS